MRATGFTGPAASAWGGPDRSRAWSEGLAAAVTGTVLEAALEAELVDHLGYRKHDRSPQGIGSNSRNGSRPKTVSTRFGAVEIRAPRDRLGTFRPVTVGKWQRHPEGVDKLVLPLAAKGAAEETNVGLLALVYGQSLHPRLLVEIARTIESRMAPWHVRSLEGSCERLVLDRIVIRSRTGSVIGVPVQSALAVAADGSRELLGLWVASSEASAEQWLAIAADLAGRGVRDVKAVTCASAPGLGQDLVALWKGLAQPGSAASST